MHAQMLFCFCSSSVFYLSSALPLCDQTTFSVPSVQPPPCDQPPSSLLYDCHHHPPYGAFPRPALVMAAGCWQRLCEWCVECFPQPSALASSTSLSKARVGGTGTHCGIVTIFFFETPAHTATSPSKQHGRSGHGVRVLIAHAAAAHRPPVLGRFLAVAGVLGRRRQKWRASDRRRRRMERRGAVRPATSRATTT
jgi:hypothetical protein